MTPYPGWGAYGASKAALLHLSRIWDEELPAHGVRVLAIDPGDMDTPLHALAVPDADPTTLKRPAEAAREIVDRHRRLRAAEERRRMRPAAQPVQRPPDARLLVVAADGSLRHTRRARLADHLGRGDFLVANDAATLPASLQGCPCADRRGVEVRLAGRRSLAADDVRDFTAVVFGAGDHRTRTEDRPPPPPLAPGDVLRLGPLAPRSTGVLGHPRLVTLRFAGDGRRDLGRDRRARQADPVRASRGAARAVGRVDPGGRPSGRLRAAVGRVRPRLAAAPRARRAGRRLRDPDPRRRHLVDRRPGLDSRLPFDEPYHIPAATVRAIAATKARSGRVVALGTTVTRALEHAAMGGAGLRAGPGLAAQRIGAGTPLRVVDAIVTGAHAPGESHYEVLRAFAGDSVLERMSAALEEHGYRTHEFGDSVLILPQDDPWRAER